MHQASVGFHCPECTKAGKQKVYQGIGSLRVAPVLTQIIIGINVAVFLIGIVLSGASAIRGSSGQMQIDFGLIAKAFDGRGLIGVGEGQWYRMITSGFLHYGLFHIGLNMYALWILGNAVESMAGRLRFGLIYLVSLLAGSFAALLLSPSTLTAGASGAIFGLMGAIFAAHRARGVALRDSPLVGILVLNLVITFAIPGISIGGHIGGLLGGALSGWLLLDLGQRGNVDKRIPLVACGALAAACLVGGVLFATGWQPG